MFSVKSSAWEKENLQEAIVKSTNMRGVFNLLKIKICSGSYRRFHQFVKEYNLDTTHFVKRKTNVANTHPRPLSDLLIENSIAGKLTNAVKRRIRDEGIIEYKCAGCGIDSWKSSLDELNEFLLQIDHINGDPTDNRVENLRFICPNCHSLTETYCGRKNRKHPKYKLCDCGTKILHTSTVCNKCAATVYHRGYKIDWPPVEEIILMLENDFYSVVCKKLGVTDRAIRNHLEMNGIKPPQSISQAPMHNARRIKK